MTLHTTLIDPDTLHDLPADEVLIVDCRFDMADSTRGHEEFHGGHVPGAVYASLDDDLSDLSRQNEGLGRHPLPLEAAFSRLLSMWGWHQGLQVVAYDAGSSALAASRLWWLLRLVGIPCAVLNGGYAAWLEAGLPTASGKAKPRAATSVALHYDASQVVLDHSRVLDKPGQRLLDARATPRFRGEVEPLDRVAGHIPGAFNRPFPDNLDGNGHFKSPQQLRAEFTAVLGDTAPGDVVHMCGSGVTACHSLLAMEYAGLSGSRLYAPSWSGWISDPQRPVATG